MSSSTLLEVFGQIVFRFTRGVTEHYNPEEPEFTMESFGYDPLQSTGREWYYLPIDELIYQEYSDKEVTSSAFLPSRRIITRLINACSPVENEETAADQEDEDSAMAWKRLRPSFLQTVCKSLYIGALITFLAAIIIGIFFLLIVYLCFKTILNCAHYPSKLIPVPVQWTRTISDAISVVFYYIWLFVNLSFLFRSYQLKGLKKKLMLVSLSMYCLDTLYRVVLQVMGMPYYLAPVIYQIPIYTCLFTSICLQLFLVVRLLCVRSRKQRLTFMCKMTTPTFLMMITSVLISDYLYAAYLKQNNKGRLAIALFAPLSGLALKIVSRICAQRLWNITHPGYSYVLLAPCYYGTAIIFRILQADLDSLKSIAILGIIHGAAEVVERSAMVVIDHICHVVCKRESAPWGHFRTPRRERLMADIAIMSMLSESTAIVSVNGFIYLYQFIYLENSSLLELLQPFAVHTSVQLVIEWFFTSVSLAIEARYQNMAVMAVWRRRWKRHVLVAFYNTLPLAVWNSSCLLMLLRARFGLNINKRCNMPFT
ncbi:uncharacterized protein LOC110055568 [Orbicella faveolata]|uniref:uncharacterized protein LOC110055568 n=1 Tax=Orbicella faveolata TaxID=48498 RepID=UPI0009E2AC44|nr:uncharacterized protein LOC110055568 [Orbicella faveolata]